MTLSARIAVGPSRRLEGLARTLAVGGLFAVAATLAARFPVATDAWFACAALASILWLQVGRRRSGAAERHVVALSDRLEVDLSSTGDRLHGSAWRLDRSSLVWPGFAVLALREEEGRTVIRLPVLDAASSGADRRALSRYLLWASRRGAGAGQRTGNLAS